MKNTPSFPDILKSAQKHANAQFNCMALKAATLKKPEVSEILSHTDGVTAIFCFEGKIDASIDEQEIRMHKGDLCIFMSRNLFVFSDASSDFKGIMVIVPPYLIADLDAHITVTYFLHSQKAPVISLPPSEQKAFQDILKLTELHASRTSHPYHKEILQAILMIVLYEICAIYQHSDPGPGERKNETLLREFLQLVEENYKEQRTLAFYARRLSLTPKYLSSAIKKLSGHSAAEWIDYILLLNVKSILRTSNMTIQQTSDYFNFPNASFFGKYFKRHTGMTPREYKVKPYKK